MLLKILYLSSTKNYILDKGNQNLTSIFLHSVIVICLEVY